jgi:hypothetical protein
MKDKLFLFLLLIVAGLLAACGGASATSEGDSSAPVVTENQATVEPGGSNTTFPARSDEQGSVTFAIVPLNLDAPDETIDFEVTMDTHSVELSWDLAAQSTLTTDSGRQVEGTSWPGGSGHHVSGTLSFPVQTADGQPLLEGARTVTLTIRDAGAAERTFAWELKP